MMTTLINGDASSTDDNEVADDKMAFYSERQIIFVVHYK